MSLFDFEKVSVKNRIIGGLIYSVFTTFLCYIIFTSLEMADYDWDYYLFFSIGLFVFGFFASGVFFTARNNK